MFRVLRMRGPLGLSLAFDVRLSLSLLQQFVEGAEVGRTVDPWPLHVSGLLSNHRSDIGLDASERMRCGELHGEAQSHQV